MEWQFPSNSSPAVYTVKSFDGVDLSCNCPGWTYKRGDKPRTCKHVRMVEAEAKAAAQDETAKAAKAETAKGVGDRHDADDTVPAPMLASAMTTPVSGAEFDRTYAGWSMEEKHDGHRITICVNGKVTAWTRPRDGKAGRRDLPEHIKAAMSHLSPGVYDGELIVPGGKSWDVTVVGAYLVFVAFDVLEIEDHSVMDLSYTERRAILLEQLARLPKDQQAVTTVVVEPASWSRVQAIWNRGGEGAILKRPESTYRPGYRSTDWVKVKQLQAAVMTVTGFEPGSFGPHSVIKLKDDEGIETSVKTKNNAMLREIANNPESFIGRRVVVSYNIRTPDKGYRHIMLDHFLS